MSEAGSCFYSIGHSLNILLMGYLTVYRERPKQLIGKMSVMLLSMEEMIGEKR